MVFCLSAVPLPLRLLRHTTRPPEPKTTHGLKTKARSCTDPPKLTLACHQPEQHPISATLCPKPEPPHDRLSNPPEPPYPPDLAVSRSHLRLWVLLTLPEPPKPPKPPDPPDPPPSRHKPTKNHSKPPTTLHPNLFHSTTNLSPVSHLKDRPLPPPSTLTPAPPSPARRSMPSTMTPANPPCPTLPSTRTPASTPHFILPSTFIPASRPHLVLPSTMTPASTQHLGGGASYTSTTGAALGFCLLGPCHCSGPPMLFRPTDENINSSTSLSRPRSDFIPSLSPNINLFCLQGLISRGLCPEATNWIWRSENLSRTLLLHGKKAQVDSKKILAQPPQSATANSGIFGDILSIAKSFHDLSFRFIPRFDNMFVDDLARTAVGSMTLGHNISLYFCFF